MARNPRRLPLHLGLVLALLSIFAVAGCGQLGTGQVDCSTAGSATGNPLDHTTEIRVPGEGSPEGITKGPDGNVWFADENQIGRITPSGTLAQFPYTPSSPCTSYCGATAIAAGRDGNLWVTDLADDDVGRITPQGIVTVFPLGIQNEWTTAITTGPDGNLWFSDLTLASARAPAATSRIGRITANGKLLPEVPIPGGGPAFGLTVGPDSAVWFTDEDGNAIGRMTVTGQLTEFPLPHKVSFPNAIALGPDGNLWFTETDGNRIGRITPTGTITEYQVPSAIIAVGCEQSGPQDITAGPDGNLWFTELSNSKLGRITVTGTITEFPLPTAHARPYDITTGPDGALWFTEAIAGKIGHLRL